MSDKTPISVDWGYKSSDAYLAGYADAMKSMSKIDLVDRDIVLETVEYELPERLSSWETHSVLYAIRCIPEFMEATQSKPEEMK